LPTWHSPRPPPGTLGSILDRWVQFQQAYGRKPRTERYFGADRPRGEIDSDALQAFVAWRQSKGKKLTGYTVNRDLAAIRAAWRHAHEDGKAPRPPKFRTLDADEPNPKPVSREEFALLMLHADERMRAVFVLAGVLGLRNSEIRRLRWRDVDLDRGRLRVDMLHSKNRSERVLPIPPAVAEVLEAHRDARGDAGAGDLVFVNRVGKMHTDHGGRWRVERDASVKPRMEEPGSGRALRQGFRAEPEQGRGSRR